MQVGIEEGEPVDVGAVQVQSVGIVVGVAPRFMGRLSPGVARAARAAAGAGYALESQSNDRNAMGLTIDD